MWGAKGHRKPILDQKWGRNPSTPDPKLSARSIALKNKTKDRPISQSERGKKRAERDDKIDIPAPRPGQDETLENPRLRERKALWKRRRYVLMIRSERPAKTKSDSEKARLKTEPGYYRKKLEPEWIGSMICQLCADVISTFSIFKLYILRGYR